jgi:hypothetical protein
MAEAAVQVAVAAQAGLAVPLATIAAFWKEFSLDARRARLDEVCPYYVASLDQQHAAQHQVACALWVPGNLLSSAAAVFAV